LYVLKEDKTVTVRPVKRGAATVDKVQIAEGLKLGEQVITEGADRLKEGAKVTLPGGKGGGGMARRLEGKRERRAPAHPAGEAPSGEHRRRNKEGAAQQ
jgi:multidrug efflux system membrane fusion protein